MTEMAFELMVKDVKPGVRLWIRDRLPVNRLETSSRALLGDGMEVEVLRLYEVGGPMAVEVRAHVGRFKVLLGDLLLHCRKVVPHDEVPTCWDRLHKPKWS